MSQIVFNDKTYDIPAGYYAVATRAVSANVANLNGDYFPASVLEEAVSSYIGCQKVFVDHVTDIPEESSAEIDRTVSRGYVEDAVFKDDTIYLLIYVSKKFPELAEAILSGGINAVSMGCMSSVVCGVCGRADDCQHLRRIENGMAEEGEFEILDDVEFIEISFVFDPADPTALIYKVVW